MNVSINFPAEIETTLLRRAAAAGKDIGTIVQEFVAERLAEESPPPAKAASPEWFSAELHRTIAQHPRSHGSVDGRAGRHHTSTAISGHGTAAGCRTDGNAADGRCPRHDSSRVARRSPGSATGPGART